MRPLTDEHKANISKGKDKYKKAVVQMDIWENVIMFHKFITDAAKTFPGNSRTNFVAIGNAIKRNNGISQGYKWKYLN